MEKLESTEDEPVVIYLHRMETLGRVDLAVDPAHSSKDDKIHFTDLGLCEYDGWVYCGMVLHPIFTLYDSLTPIKPSASGLKCLVISTPSTCLVQQRIKKENFVRRNLDDVVGPDCSRFRWNYEYYNGFGSEEQSALVGYDGMQIGLFDTDRRSVTKRLDGDQWYYAISGGGCLAILPVLPAPLPSITHYCEVQVYNGGDGLGGVQYERSFGLSSST